MPINIPISCIAESFSPDSTPQITGKVAHATAVIGATIAIGPLASPLYSRARPPRPKLDASTPRKKSLLSYPEKFLDILLKLQEPKRQEKEEDDKER